MTTLNRSFLLLGIVLLLGVVALGVWLHGSDAAPAQSPVATAAAGQPVLVQGASLPSTTTVAAPLPGQDSPLAPVPATQADAVASMSEARQHGDAREPAVVRDAPREMPTQAELADPDAYQRYEERQNQRLYKAYVKAADDEIPRLQQDIARARQEGMSEEQLREGEEKLRRIQAMRDQLRADHPETAAAP